MQALVLMGFVLATAVMWVGVIMTMLIGLHRAEHRSQPEAPEPATKGDPDAPTKHAEMSEAPPTGWT